MCKPISRTLRKLVLFHLPTSDKAKITFMNYSCIPNSMLLDILTSVSCYYILTSVLSKRSYHLLHVVYVHDSIFSAGSMMTKPRSMQLVWNRGAKRVKFTN